jgi:hypothetical protein
MCCVVVTREPGSATGSARVRMQMTDDVESGVTAEVQVLGADDACSTLRAWLEGLMAAGPPEPGDPPG